MGIVGSSNVSIYLVERKRRQIVNQSAYRGERECESERCFLLPLRPIMIVRALLIDYFVWDYKGNDLNG